MPLHFVEMVLKLEVLCANKLISTNGDATTLVYVDAQKVGN